MAHRITHALDERIFLNDDELDTIRALLVYILMKNSTLDKDNIYQYIFGEGKSIIWH